MQICEMGSLIQGYWFREIRKLTESGHQTAIITTHPDLIIRQVAGKMFSRWGQENFFKYMAENFDFDRIIQYGTETLANLETTLPNPEYKRLTYNIKKLREKRARLQAQVFSKLEKTPLEDKLLQKIIAQNAQLTELLTDYTDTINELLSKRKSIPSRIKVKNLPEDIKYNKLIEESKKLKNLVLMLSCRAETALYNLLPDFYSNAKKDGRQILKEIFTSCADLIPDKGLRTNSTKTNTTNGGRSARIRK